MPLRVPFINTLFLCANHTQYLLTNLPSSHTFHQAPVTTSLCLFALGIYLAFLTIASVTVTYTKENSTVNTAVCLPLFISIAYCVFEVFFHFCGKIFAKGWVMDRMLENDHACKRTPFSLPLGGSKGKRKLWLGKFFISCSWGISQQNHLDESWLERLTQI